MDTYVRLFVGLSIQLLLVLLSTGNESVYDAIDIIMYIHMYT